MCWKIVTKWAKRDTNSADTCLLLFSRNLEMGRKNEEKLKMSSEFFRETLFWIYSTTCNSTRLKTTQMSAKGSGWITSSTLTQWTTLQLWNKEWAKLSHYIASWVRKSFKSTDSKYFRMGFIWLLYQLHNFATIDRKQPQTIKKKWASLYSNQIITKQVVYQPLLDLKTKELSLEIWVSQKSKWEKSMYNVLPLIQDRRWICSFCLKN